jgi:hypothetical protein
MLILTSCLDTLYPIFTADDVEFDPSLLGTWKYKDDNQKTHFNEFKKLPTERKNELTGLVSSITDKCYLESSIDSSGLVEQQNFVFLVKLDDHYYLDYYPAELSSDKMIDQAFKDHQIKTHKSYRIDFASKDLFHLRRFDKGFLDNLIMNNKINIRHVSVQRKNVITASTRELQKFIIQYGENPKAYANDILCTRVKYY